MSRESGHCAIAGCLAVGAITLAVLGTLGRALNFDEATDLHIAWLIHRGQVPWRAFFHNHPDLHLAGLAALFSIASPEWVTYRLGKLVAIAYGLLFLGATGALTHRLSSDRAAALWAVALAASNFAFTYNLMEVRGELLGAAFLCFAWCGIAGSRPTRAGFWAGLAACQNQKIAFFVPFLIGAAIVRIPESDRRRVGGGRGGVWRMLAGVSLAPAVMLLGLAFLGRGVLGSFLRWNVGMAVALAPTIDAGRNLDLLRDFLVLSPLLPVAAAVGLARMACSARGVRVPALAAVAAVLYALVSPYPNSYNLAHAVAVFSCLAGIALAGGAPARWGPFSRAAVTGLVLVWLAVYHGMAPVHERWRWWTGTEAQAQWAAIRSVSAHVPADALLLDGVGALGRASPIPFTEMTANTTRLAGRLPELLPDIAAALARTGTRFVALDGGTRALAPSTVRFIERNYLPVCGVLRCRGVAVPAPAPAAGEADVMIEVPGDYRVARAGSSSWISGEGAGQTTAVAIDGTPVGSAPIRLSAGRHRVKGSAGIELRSDLPWDGPDPWSLPGLAVQAPALDPERGR